MSASNNEEESERGKTLEKATYCTVVRKGLNEPHPVKPQMKADGIEERWESESGGKFVKVKYVVYPIILVSFN